MPTCYSSILYTPFMDVHPLFPISYWRMANYTNTVSSCRCCGKLAAEWVIRKHHDQLFCCTNASARMYCFCGQLLFLITNPHDSQLIAKGSNLSHIDVQMNTPLKPIVIIWPKCDTSHRIDLKGPKI